MKPSPPGIAFGAQSAAQNLNKNRRRAKIVRVKRRREAAAWPVTELAVTPITLPQTVVMLSLSRGEQPKVFPPITRRKLLRKRWILPLARDPGSKEDRRAELTDAGRRALAASPFLAAAERILVDGARRQQPWL